MKITKEQETVIKVIALIIVGVILTTALSISFVNVFG